MTACYSVQHATLTLSALTLVPFRITSLLIELRAMKTETVAHDTDLCHGSISVGLSPLNESVRI